MKELHFTSPLCSSSSNSSSPSNSSSSTSPLHPTFVEFVRFLIAKTPPGDDVTTKRLRGSKNVHWTPFHVNCAPCDIDYDVILNMETINEDTRYVSERFRLGLQEGVWKNRAKTNSTEVTALGLFKTLPRNYILALHQRFRTDFLMFGYSLTPFLAET
ncbi:carbohydrate sulfotransferase 11-like [Eriocheir sinensis]|uniref:carbohydrate sulfotransferase 11-like n=1 Tax=Eriocheir sinensis TaxID=95602 RepID=UPI0021C91127|nr:carbohydrate sulfotransferase 11-like [Eriocheir sinensis]